jgi:hypothetical protein
MAENFPNKLRMIFFEAAPSFRKNKDLIASSLAFSALSHFFHRRRARQRRWRSMMWNRLRSATKISTS